MKREGRRWKEKVEDEWEKGKKFKKKKEYKEKVEYEKIKKKINEKKEKI